MSGTLVENNLSFSKVPRIGLHVRDLSIIASKTNTKLVDSFSMDLESGSIMAVMGGSGSGKTTLLNVLASKISGGLTTEGTIKYVLEQQPLETLSSPSESLRHTELNSKKEVIITGIENESEAETDFEERHVKMSYVPQQDVLSARLTCRETMMFAADLKLDKPKEEKIRIVEQLINELGLKDCADTMVGDSTHRGLSGGEKRRLSVGTQMVANPSIMFLDEPTTGLDAYSAYLVVKTIKKMAKEDGRIFIMSIHQPRSDILFLFDQICILSKGNVVYCDTMTTTIPYFEKIGFKVPHMVNPADYFVDLSSVDGRSDDAQKLTEERLEKLVENWHNFERDSVKFDNIDHMEPLHVQNMTTSLPFMKQVAVLTRRNIRLNVTDYVTLGATFLEPIIISTVSGWIYYKPDKTTLSGLRTTSACLYSSVILQCYLYLLFDTYRLCEQDIALFDRERAEGSVSPAAFIAARKLSLFLSDDILMTLTYTTISYFMFGLEADATKFFIQFSVNFLAQMCCSALAMLSVAVSRDYSKASLVGNLSFTVLSMGCGFFVNAKVMPVYVRWTKYIAFTWYGYGALLSNTFTDKYCTDDTLESCMGNQIIESFGFWRNWRTVPIIILFCWVIGFTVVGVVIMYLHKVDITLQNEVKSKKKKKSSSDGKEDETKNKSNPFLSIFDSKSQEKDVEATTSRHEHEIAVTLKDINLKVNFTRLNRDKWSSGFIEKEEKQILKSVNANFKPGMVNAIMGPSGSGKSTLLNLMSARVHSNLVTKFTKKGSILFNNVEVSEDMFKNICSYVSQDDDHLLAKLTVKETFKFAAALRLHHLTPEQREAKSDELIRALGIKHCENTIIGNEFVKGISGGEKRRVTMGIQLLNDPPILLLDEPTSGLDSFTSSTILEILQGLADNYGKTIILTIHQPRSELFDKFGNILLLAKSGRTAFNGTPKEMIEYFSDLGYQCPELTNVADYFLDLISINTQNDQNEKISRERVESLLTNWDTKSDSISKQDMNETTIMTKELFHTTYGDCIRRPCNSVLAYFVNVKRQLTTTLRDFDSLMARIAQVPGLGAIFALYFAPLKENYVGVTNRLGLAQESTSLYFVGMLANLACYPQERDYFYKEFEDNVYGIGPFFLSYMTLELPLSAFASIIYAIFTVLACGLPRTAGNFFATVYCSFLVTSCGEALGIMTNTFFERPGFVVNCISVLLSIGTQMSGLMSLNMSRVLKGFNYLNPVGYTSMIIINMAFPDDLKLTCKDGGQLEDGSCEFSTGKDVIDSYNLRTNVSEYLGIAICVAAIYRLLAYFALKAKLEWFSK
ncbi:similar to Saccharomyces cerevisiae YOL075C Putative ABC transporter [Maudiozyma saulgeensis]|uniref:Similar to Saccharomyces cerevisiae YOL075C Putative ABC transporter n=1 Tax=Maudiozyma saulgeensis TaxID=1789683 RepID=A0A1X7RBA7_9SACH|nr:similar to Saccharomyces cerevisiae YOL075C Putative ABC transporter [Kazachstania saulgeensis]